MQSISVFLDITKVTSFRWKKCRTQEVCHVIYIFLGSPLNHVIYYYFFFDSPLDKV